MDPEAFDAAVTAEFEHAVDFLQRLVSQDSSLGRETGALTVFSEELRELGFTVSPVPFDPGLPADPRSGAIQPVDGARENAIAILGDSRHTHLMLHGHMDVVPAATPELWTTPPFQPRREADRMYGRGVGDMKCGFAMGVLALRALRAVQPKMDTWSLSFLAAIEEECTGNGTLTAARQGYLADAVVLLEPTDLNLLAGGVGIEWVDISVVGRSAHAEQAHRAINPFDLIWHIVTGLREWAAQLNHELDDPMLDGVDNPYNVNLGEIRGGDWPSSVPTTALARIRIAHPRAWDPAEAQRRIIKTITQISRDRDFPNEPTVVFSGFRAPGYLQDPGHELVTSLSDAHLQVHGERPRIVGIGSTTDARTYVEYFDTPAICYGPVADSIHGIDESVDLLSIRDGARALGRFIDGWFES